MDALTAQCATQSVGTANQLLGLLIQSILSSYCADSKASNLPDYGPTVLSDGLHEYDFIVVGAGSAGAVMANRLSENPNWKVLLLEAGGDQPIESKIPGLVFTLWDSDYDWKYRVEDSPNNNTHVKNMHWPRGKMLGGSSSINAMIHIRGNSRDYDTWEKLGNPTWGWNDVTEYFKKSENVESAEILNSPLAKHRGTNGLLKVEPFRKDLFHDAYSRAGTELGYKTLVDSTEEFVGLVKIVGAFDNGVRSSTAKAFLSSITDRSNLHVIKNAHVTKILIDRSGVTKGVEFKVNDTVLTAVQRKEVILSAGAIGTPQLLMLSGIGQRSDLEQHGIETIKDLPVGQNLQDHVTTTVLFKIKKPYSEVFTLNLLGEGLLDFIKSKSGWLTRNNLLDLSAFFNTVNQSDPFPNVQVVGVRFHRGMHIQVQELYDRLGYDQEVFKGTADHNKDSEVLFFSIALLNPKSIGEIKLKSADPAEYPEIQPNFLEHIEDVQALAGAIKILHKFMRTKALQEIGMEDIRLNLPQCGTYASDEYWECYVRHVTYTMFHPVGTAKMGPISDKSAVVDSRLRVKGVKGLRVADASIMPTLVSANTNAPTIMIGEKGADFVKEDWASENQRLHDEI